MFERLRYLMPRVLLALLGTGGCGMTEDGDGRQSGGAGAVPSDGGSDVDPSGGSGGSGGASGSAGSGGGGGSGGASGSAGSAGNAGSAGTGGTATWLHPKCDPSAPATGAAVQGECNAEGWCFENPLPRTLDVTSIWGFASDDVWLSAREGLYHYGGGSWSRVGSRNGGIWGSAPDDVWLVHEQGIDHYDGNSWTAASSIGPLNAIHGVGASEAWAVGDDGLVAQLGATGWTVVPAFTSKDLRGVWVAAPGDVWLLAFDGLAGELLHRVGTTVTSVTPSGWSAVNAVWSASPSDVWLGGRLSGGWGRLARFDGNAITEVPLPPGTSSIRTIWGFESSDVWLGTSSEILHWDGSAMTKVASPLSVADAALWGASSADIWSAGGSPGQLAHYDGNAWKALGLQATQFEKVWGSAWNNLWTVGYADAISAHFDGSVWTVVPVPTSAVLTAVTGVGGEAYAVDDKGGLFLNTGAGWSAVANAGTPLRDAQAVAPGQVLIGGDGYVAHFDNGVLTPLPSYSGEIDSLWASAPNDIWVVGGDSVGRWDGAQWNDVSLAQATNHGGFRGVIGVSASEVYVMNFFGVYHYDGTTWTDIDAAPTGPRDPWACDSTLWVGNSFGDIVRIQGGNVVQTYDADAQISALWAASPTHIVGVGNSGAILRLAK